MRRMIQAGLIAGALTALSAALHAETIRLPTRQTGTNQVVATFFGEDDPKEKLPLTALEITKIDGESGSALVFKPQPAAKSKKPAPDEEENELHLPLREKEKLVEALKNALSLHGSAIAKKLETQETLYDQHGCRITFKAENAGRATRTVFQLGDIEYALQAFQAKQLHDLLKRL